MCAPPEMGRGRLARKAVKVQLAGFIAIEGKLTRFGKSPLGILTNDGVSTPKSMGGSIRKVSPTVITGSESMESDKVNRELNIQSMKADSSNTQ